MESIYTFASMNTRIQTYNLPHSVNRKVEYWFHVVEETLSRFNDESELSLLNKSERKEFKASPLLFHVIEIADYYYKETDGIFNPYLGKEIAALGYNCSFDKLKNQQSIQTLFPRRNLMQDPLFLNRKQRTLILSKNISVDLGGIAKGWAAQQIAKHAEREGVKNGVIDAGGDIIVWGNKRQGWDFTIDNPFKANDDLVYFEISQPTGIATSSRLKRQWQNNNGQVLHHILDPRTLKPSHSDLVQVTVLAPDLIKAEVYAKYILILGWEKGLKWLENKEQNLGVIAVSKDRKVLVEGSVEQYCDGWEVIK